ncbi:MAG TPA: ATP-binding protein, partial [Flavobacteriales bacterium]|nr:ATP-binding protein [Flavobacteriales bacterium]
LSRSASGSLHDVVHATDASTDSSTALVEHARTIAHRLLDHSAVQHTIDVEHIGAEVPVGPATKRDLLMILKEAINNALKHAQAERIDVVFRVEDGHFKLEVADDGNGFDPVQASGGNGLRNMRARAEQLRSELRMATNGERGTRLTLISRI